MGAFSSDAFDVSSFSGLAFDLPAQTDSSAVYFYKQGSLYLIPNQTPKKAIENVVCFPGVIVDINYNGTTPNHNFNGDLETFSFNGTIAEQNINGTLSALFFKGAISGLEFNGKLQTDC